MGKEKKGWLYSFGLAYFEFEVPEEFPSKKYLVGSWLWWPTAQKRELGFWGNDKSVINTDLEADTGEDEVIQGECVKVREGPMAQDKTLQNTDF